MEEPKKNEKVVDAFHPDATNYNNPNGTPEKPRLTPGVGDAVITEK